MEKETKFKKESQEQNVKKTTKQTEMIIKEVHEFSGKTTHAHTHIYLYTSFQKFPDKRYCCRSYHRGTDQHSPV